MSVCMSKQVLEITEFVLLVFQRFEDFWSGRKLFPNTLILAKVRVTVAFVS